MVGSISRYQCILEGGNQESVKPTTVEDSPLKGLIKFFLKVFKFPICSYVYSDMPVAMLFPF